MELEVIIQNEFSPISGKKYLKVRGTKTGLAIQDGEGLITGDMQMMAHQLCVLRKNSKAFKHQKDRLDVSVQLVGDQGIYPYDIHP